MSGQVGSPADTVGYILVNYCTTCTTAQLVQMNTCDVHAGLECSKLV